MSTQAVEQVQQKIIEQVNKILVSGEQQEDLQRLLLQEEANLDAPFLSTAVLPLLKPMVHTKATATVLALMKQDAIPYLKQVVIPQIESYLLLLRLYLEQPVFKKSNFSIYQPVLSLMLDSSLQLLERMGDDAPLMDSLLQVFEKFATNHVSLFKPKFQDVIDILVGWFLDRATSESMRQVIGNGFARFQSLWITNSDFTIHLLDKFISDMQVLTDEQDFLIFIRCFSAIVQSLGSFFSVPARKLFARLLSVFEATVNRFPDKSQTLWDGK
jgi:hypothetical protein